MQGRKALMAAGHSARRAPRGDRDQAARHAAPNALRVALVSTSGGEHTMLLVRKKVGMERVSILDDDKQGGGGGGGGGRRRRQRYGSLSKWVVGGGAQRPTTTRCTSSRSRRATSTSASSRS